MFHLENYTKNELETRICKNCNREFTALKVRNTIFCSNTCSLRNRNKEKREQREKLLKNIEVPVCSYEGCNNQCELVVYKSNKIGFRKLCTQHWGRKYYKPHPKLINNNKYKRCLYCGYDLELTLHKHHIEKGKRICLCANCHNILHRLFQSKRLERMTVQEVIQHLAVVYNQHKRKKIKVIDNKFDLFINN